ncbi:hypothetical protein K8I61_17005 [bacterium]|nr:hypothetical protein [bacterium]
MLIILLTISYLTVILGVATGFVRMASPGNEVSRILHRACGPASAFLYAVYFLAMQFVDTGEKQRIALAVLFVLLVYTAAASGRETMEPRQKFVHLTLGVLTLLLFSAVYIVFMMHWTGVGASSIDAFG